MTSAPSLTATNRSIRRNVLFLGLFICATDLVYGMVSPTFSLFVEHLGGSALIVGVLAGVVGITRLLGSFPVGAISDGVGRKTVLTTGAALFAGSCLLFTLVSNPLVLIGPRILFAVAILATFPLGIAYIADFVPPSSQTLAISIYVAAQGLGFALGPLLGAALISHTNYATAYRVAAAIALATAIAAWRFLRSVIPSLPQNRRPTAPGQLLKGPILSASTSNVFMMMMFSGAILPFLSLYAATIGMSTFAIGLLYAIRAAASTLIRIPAGYLARRLTNAHIMIVAVVADAIAAFAVSASRSAIPLTLAATLDGLAFGAYLGSSQSLVAENAPLNARGAAMGTYATAGALGETAGAFTFGAIAHTVGIRAIFVVVGAGLAFAGVAGYRLLSRTTPGAPKDTATLAVKP